MACNRQYASAYAVYMIIGSEFNKCTFANPVLESKFKLEYAEMKSTDQIRLEESIIDKVPDLHISEDEDSRIHVSDDHGEMLLSFDSNTNHLDAYIAPDGRYRLVSHTKARK